MIQKFFETLTTNQIQLVSSSHSSEIPSQFQQYFTPNTTSTTSITFNNNTIIRKTHLLEVSSSLGLYEQMEEALSNETDISIIAFDFDLTLTVKHAFGSLHLQDFKSLEKWQRHLSQLNQSLDNDFIEYFFGSNQRIKMINEMFEILTEIYGIELAIISRNHRWFIMEMLELMEWKQYFDDINIIGNENIKESKDKGRYVVNRKDWECFHDGIVLVDDDPREIKAFDDAMNSERGGFLVEDRKGITSSDIDDLIDKYEFDILRESF